MRHPRHRRAGIIDHPCGDDTVVVAPDGAAHRLDPVAAEVWRHADGTQGIEDLLAVARRVRADTDRTLVFEVLDRLADAGLLEERFGPPAGLSRRALVQRLAGASAAAALGLVMSMPRSAAAASCGETEAVVGALKRLAEEQAAIAGELEAMVQESIDAEAPQTAMIDALGAKEEASKAEAAKLDELHQLAKFDATSCGTEEGVSARKKRLEQAYLQRKEQHTKRRAAHQEKHTKRMKAGEAQEQAAKSKLAAQEKKQKAGASKEAQLESKRQHQEQAQKLKQRHVLRRRAQEKHHKQHLGAMEELKKRRTQRHAAARKQPEAPLVAQDEAAQAKVADEKRAAAVKKAGGAKEHAKQVAKEQQLKASHSIKAKKARSLERR